MAMENEEGGDSMYEQQRLANIKANQAKLATLGFAQSSPNAHKNKGPGVSKQASKQARKKERKQTLRRRSRRREEDGRSPFDFFFLHACFFAFPERAITISAMSSQSQHLSSRARASDFTFLPL
jgi:hypothetical protein